MTSSELMPDTKDMDDVGKVASFGLKRCIITDIITISCIVFAFTVLIPICVYFIHPLFKKRRDIILQKRHINLSLLAIICLIIQLVAENLNALIDFDVIYAMKHGQTTVRIMRFIFASIYCWTVAVFIFTTFVRFYLIYFDIKYNVLMANDEWKSIINHNHNSEEKTSTFFIKYKSTLGSEQWWMRFVIIDAVIAAIVSPILAWYKKDDLLYVHNGFFYILFVVIYFKLRQVRFWDDFYIVQELRKLGIAIAFLICIWATIRVSVEILQYMTENNMKFRNEIWMTSYLYAVYALSMLYDIYVVYTTAWWVLKKLRNDPALQIHYRHQSSVINLPTPTLSYELQTSNSTTLNKRKRTDSYNTKPTPICLKKVLSTPEYLECFIQHLSHEFSLECILSFIEFMQFKKFIKSRSKQDTPEIEHMGFHSRADTSTSECLPDLSSLDSYELADNIMKIKSTIVYDENDDLETKATKLYQKYIAIGSEFEINIASGPRSKLAQRFEPQVTKRAGGMKRVSLSIQRRFSRNISPDIPSKLEVLPKLASINENKEKNVDVVDMNEIPDDLLTVFDESCSIMIQLLGFSLTRFKTKPEWLKVLKQEFQTGNK